MEGVVVTMAMYRLSPGSSLEKESVVIVMTTHPLFQIWERRGCDHAHTHLFFEREETVEVKVIDALHQV